MLTTITNLSAARPWLAAVLFAALLDAGCDEAPMPGGP
jgi:hypothetical protein